ncbi:MAG: flagellar assembly protein FliH [Gammaproteobacteria bacterium]|nr:flagellar assembly protein FliH [Gammaproteobacteria bacterium]
MRYSAADLEAIARPFTPPLVEGPIAGEDYAPALKVPTAEELEALQRAAHEEGFREGFADGRQRGYASGEAAVKAQLDALQGIVLQLAEPLEKVDDAVVQAVSDLAVLIARHLVRRELKANPGEVVGVVRESMRHLPIAPRAARIRLHPEDAELVQSAFALGDDERSWRLEPDPLITRGGCIVETDSSRIDASVESRLAAIASKMLGGERESDRAR